MPHLSTRPRPGLAVDTSFSRHQGKAPEQVFPYESRTEQPGFISLSDVRALGNHAPKKTKSRKGDDLKQQQLESKVYVAPTTQKRTAAINTQQRAGTKDDVLPAFSHSNVGSALPYQSQSQSSLQAPPLHKRIKGLRPAPLELSNDVSPSDRAIPIGIAVPSAALSNHESPQSTAPYPHSPPRSQHSQKYGQEATTPTIVITPAKEDFESGLKSSPEEIRNDAINRPTSSMYSRYTNGALRTTPPFKRTPPVPPLPLFASKSNASLRNGNALSVCTVFEEEEEGSVVPSASWQVNSKRRSSQSNVPTPRRSKGWWNVLTSPFSAKSAVFSLRSPAIAEEDEDQPILSGASDLGQSQRSGVAFRDRAADEDELRSAPPPPYSAKPPCMKTAIPKRSDTAPGALDLGKADEVNIYRLPGDGAGASYYNSNRSFPSMIAAGAPDATRGMDDLSGFDPRQSCYQEPRSSKSGTPIDDTSEMRDSVFYRVPSQGEAAPYYDPKRTFPSFVPHGEAIGEPGMEDWTPRRSVARDANDSSISGGDSEGLFQSPIDVNNTRELDEDDGRSPFHDSHAVKLDDCSRAPAGKGQIVERSPFDSGHAAEFEGFTGTYGPTERGFFSTPSENEFNDQSTPKPLTTCTYGQGIQSPMSETTPIVENARTATFTRPPQFANGELREIDVASTRTQTPVPAGPGAGLKNATMASRDMQETAYGSNMEPLSEKTPCPRATHTRNDSYSLGISDNESERALFPPQQSLSEKQSGISAVSNKRTAKAKTGGRPCCQRFLCLFAVIAALLIASLVVALVMFIPLRHDAQPVQAQWLNLTGFPPLPTGVATVVGPDTAKNVNGCVNPEQFWSCAVPPNQGESTSSSNQPNFRFEIMFRNHMLPSNETEIEPSNSTLSKRNLGHAARAGEVVRRDFWTSSLFSSAPSPPSMDDQIFLGHTTENVSKPYNGEQTPFYISVMNASTVIPESTSKLRKRDKGFKYPYPTTSSADSSPSSTASSDGSPKIPQNTSSADAASAPEIIPNPYLDADGESTAPQLYPFAYAQPLRLFNRGQDSEHYGFYTYYDRTIYVSSSSNSTSSSNSSTIGLDLTSNVPLKDASAVCTWSQTRMIVQIWTRKSGVTSLAASTSTDIPAFQSSANDMSAPGSFPYPVTITLDRHGGSASDKGVSCYKLDKDHRVIKGVRTWVAEDRSFGGTLVHPAAVPTNNGASISERSDGSSRGIDGGSGGCTCQWQNWG